MKLNQRDKMLLITILVILIWVVGVMMFIKPAVESVSAASDELDSKEMELSTLQAQIKEDENLPQEVDDAYDAATELASVFYDKMLQHAAATEIQSLLDLDGDSSEQEIQNLDLSVSTMSSFTLTRYVYTAEENVTALDQIVADATDATADTATETVDTSAEVSNYTFEFTYEATKADLMEFISNLQTNTHRSLIITDLSISNVAENEDDTVFSGSMSLNLLMVPELEDPQEVDSDTEVEEVNAEEETEE